MARPMEAGRWRFKKSDGLVYGPVPASVVAEQIGLGELDATAPVAAEDGPFRPLGEVADFKADLLRAAAGRRVQAEADVVQGRARRRRAWRIAGLCAAGLAAVAAVAGGAAWLASASGELGMPDDLGEIGITVSPPEVRSLARKAPEAGDLIAYDAPGAPARPPPPAPDPKRAAPAPAPAPPKLADARPVPPPAPPKASADREGLELGPQYDQERINSTVRKNQSSLFSCFAEEKRRSPDFSGKVPIEFTIQNDGRVGKLWVDVARFRQGPLYECLTRKLSEWRFDKYPGEQANVSIAFGLK